MASGSTLSTRTSALAAHLCETCRSGHPLLPPGPGDPVGSPARAEEVMSTRLSTPVTNAETMSAIVQDAYGTAPEAVLRLAHVARPTIADDEVLVRVAAASVDMGTVHCMTGKPYAMRLAGFGVRSPKASNPGRAVAGTVESVGKNVTAFMPSDEVYGSCDGSFAEYARVETNMLAPKPTNLSFAQAAAVPISGGTALQAVR